MRIEISSRPEIQDGTSQRLLQNLGDAISSKISQLIALDVYLVNFSQRADVEAVAQMFTDPVAQRYTIAEGIQDGVLRSSWIDDELGTWDFCIEVSYKPGVTDPVAITAMQAILREFEGDARISSEDIVVQTAKLFIVAAKDSTESAALAEEISRELYNPLIQQSHLLSRSQFETGSGLPLLYPRVENGNAPEVEHFSIQNMSEPQLRQLSKNRLLALNDEEMLSIQAYFSQTETQKFRKKMGLPEHCTDVELEMLAQTWSEHCKHKIFAARIEYQDEIGAKQTIDGLFKEYIKKTTEELTPGRPDLRSVFHDDSGVVDFDEDFVLCFKAETHNSPSALDPYGGAITGIVGVNRDIMGTGKGAKPIFNTNVLCFGPPDIPQSEIPEGLLHPKKVMRGVHEGIIDGGNQSGIPTVGGAFLFDESYLGKPLVFCGTGGIMPRTILGEPSWIQHVDAGDLAVMLGGRIGKDGIHGATFSSLALDEESPTSAVQIGDPITQRLMLDFLLEARDLGLYKGITDNGAGGLSSSLGEMAEIAGGIRVELDKAPLKYQGLAPWEIWVSESQERMSLSVDKEHIDAFLELARRRSVEATVVGSFNDSGAVELFFEGKPVGGLSLEFLHNGLPQMHLNAIWLPAEERRPQQDADSYIRDKQQHFNNPNFVSRRLEDLLREPNIRSKESLIRQYDHEVQGMSVVKPCTGLHADAPSDGAVLRPRDDSFRGVTVTHGIAPRMSDVDGYQMAAHALDEAFRAHIALGGNPDRASGLDNFCWPDPIQSEQTPDGSFKLAQLVRANRGLRDACLAYNVPLISGKDSMKNDAQLGGKKVSVRPTLLVSLMGIHDDIRRVPAQGWNKPGIELYVLGGIETALGGSFFEKIEGTQLGNCPEIRLSENTALYRSLARAIESGIISCIHDISDGGMLVALAESCLFARIGANCDLAHVRARLTSRTGDISTSQIAFAEGGGRFIVGIEAHEAANLKKIFSNEQLCYLGTTGGDALNIVDGESDISIHYDRIASAFQGAW